MASASPSLWYWEDDDQGPHPKATIPGGGPNSFYLVSIKLMSGETIQPKGIQEFTDRVEVSDVTAGERVTWLRITWGIF